MGKKKRVIITPSKYFDGKRYTFSKAFMKKPQAKSYAIALRGMGKLARVIPTGILRRKWLVYVR